MTDSTRPCIVHARWATFITHARTMSVDEYSRCIRGQLCAHSLLNTQKNKIGGRAKSKQGRRCNKKLCREDGGSFCPVPGCVNDKGKRSCSCCTECKVEHAKWHADHASDMQTDAAGEATGGSEGGSPGALDAAENSLHWKIVWSGWLALAHHLLWRRCLC